MNTINDIQLDNILWKNRLSAIKKILALASAMPAVPSNIYVGCCNGICLADEPNRFKAKAIVSFPNSYASLISRSIGMDPFFNRNEFAIYNEFDHDFALKKLFYSGDYALRLVKSRYASCSDNNIIENICSLSDAFEKLKCNPWAYVIENDLNDCELVIS